MTTPLDLAPIKERLSDLFPAPWSGDETGIYDDVDSKLGVLFIREVEEEDEGDVRLNERLERQVRNTGVFLGAARTDVPNLVAEVERLRTALVETKAEALGRMPLEDMFAGWRKYYTERACEHLTAKGLLPPE